MDENFNMSLSRGKKLLEPILHRFLQWYPGRYHALRVLDASCRRCQFDSIFSRETTHLKQLRL